MPGKRIVMWATPRTLSTAFTRAMVSREGCKILNEPAIKTFLFSEDREITFEFYGEKRPEGWPEDKDLPLPGCAWKDYYKNLDEQPEEGYSEIFVKELSFRFKRHLDEGTMDHVFPADYIHVFMIRDPEKSIRSWFKILDDFPVCILDHAKKGKYKNRPPANEMHEASWAELQRLYDWVVKEKGYRPLVIDADDLQREPEKVLRRFCEFVDLDFQQTMVNWPPVPPDQKQQFEFFGDFFKLAKEGTQFLPSTSTRDVTRPEYVEILDETIARAKQVFDNLKASAADKTFCSQEK